MDLSFTADGRWVGLHWPADHGGRDASPVQVAIFNMEYARARDAALRLHLGPWKQYQIATT